MKHQYLAPTATLLPLQAEDILTISNQEASVGDLVRWPDRIEQL